MLGEEHSRQKEEQCKGPEAGVSLVRARNREEAGVAGAEGVRGESGR